MSCDRRKFFLASSIKKFLGCVRCVVCRKGPGVDSIHGTDGVCCQEAGAQAEEMMECKDCRVSKHIPSERIANASMSVGLSGPVCHTAVVCNRNRKS